MLRLLDADRIETSFLRDAALTTTVKLRVIGRQQQLLRIDFETAPPHELLAAKLAEYDALLANADALVLSDYGKGGLAHIATMIERARAAGKPVLVDPKGEDWDRYRGATVITPNRSEFRQVAGRSRDEADLAQRAQALRATSRSSALLVTRSEEGMSLYSDDGSVDDSRAGARSVRRFRRGRHGHRHARRAARGGRVAVRRDVDRQRGGRRRRRQARHRRRRTRTS